MQDSPQQITPLRGVAISPLLKSQHQSNLSLTNYSWDKTLFDGLQNQKHTEEDQGLYSYSKFSASNPQSEIKVNGKEQAYHIPGNYSQDEYNPLRDYPKQMTHMRTGSTTQASKQKSQQEDLQSALYELSKRISFDQITIQKLQDTIQDKDKIIVQLQKSQQWSRKQAETTIMNALSQRDELNGLRQNRKLQQQVVDSESQVKLSETQLRNSLRQLNTLEKENCVIKNDKLILEQDYYQLVQKENRFDIIKEQLQQELDEQKYQSEEFIKQLQFQITDQKNVMKQQHEQLKRFQDQNLERKPSYEKNLAYYSYRKKQQLDTKTEGNSLNFDHQTKFVECIVDMVQNCQKSTQKPNLKRCWKWLKNILQEYMHLKQDDQQKQNAKSSQQKLLSMHSNQSKEGQVRIVLKKMHSQPGE